MSGSGELLFDQPSQNTLRVKLFGNWRLAEPLPSAEDVRRKLESTGSVRQIVLNTDKLGEWDTGLLTFVYKLWQFCSSSDIARFDGTLDGDVMLVGRWTLYGQGGRRC